MREQSTISSVRPEGFTVRSCEEPREHDEEADATLEAVLRAERDVDDAPAYHALMQADW